jgi:hypothetical protein
VLLKHPTQQSRDVPPCSINPNCDTFRAMTKQPQRTPDDPEQSKRFVDTAREIGADETEEGARKAFKKVVPRNPEKAR